MKFPKELFYTKTHEWLKKQDDVTVIIGISDFAQNQLGDIVYVDFTIDVNDNLSKGDSFCEIESVKAVESVYMPISGTIIEVNTELDNDYSILNSSPYQGGWLIKIKIDNLHDLTELISSEQYTKYIEELEKESEIENTIYL